MLFRSKNFFGAETHFGHAGGLHDVAFSAVFLIQLVAWIVIVGGAQVAAFRCRVEDVFHEHAAVAGRPAPFFGQDVADFKGRLQLVGGKK